MRNEDIVRLAQNIVMAANQITVDATDAINYPTDFNESMHMRNLRSMLNVITENAGALKKLAQ